MGFTKTEGFTDKQKRIADLAKVLAHPARIAIIQHLLKAKSCVCGDLVEVLPLAQATVSQHLKELKQIGILHGEINPPRVCYCINETVWQEAKTILGEILRQKWLLQIGKRILVFYVLINRNIAMNSSNPMNWQAFKNRLLENPDQVLQFQYGENLFVDTSYHITEIKQAPIVSVDCGGVMNSWTELIVQLWEPPVAETERAMKVSKTLSIINLVEKSLPLNPNAMVKIEFGNSKFDTCQMYPGEFYTEGDACTVNLVPDFTQCKALSRNESYGTTTSAASCCGPVAG